MPTLKTIVNRIKQRSFVNEEVGATAVEYGLMTALIAGIIVVAVQALGASVNAAFLQVGGALAGV